VRVEGVTDQRPDNGAALRGDQFLQIRIAIIGRGFEIAAEGGLGIADESRPVQVSVKPDEKGPVIGDEFGEQRNKEQQEKNPQRPKTPAVRFEILPAPAVKR
jgi:hypothetical protein